MTGDTRGHTKLGAGGEFDLIRSLLDVWGDLAIGIGDDAAILPACHDGESTVISVDACVEDVHFKRDWMPAGAIGVRAAAAALSDIAAMGARASSVLVSFILPENWTSELEQVAEGIGSVVRNAGARIVGGNISRGERLSITTTVTGHAIQPIARTGAHAGDVLLLTGVLGGPAMAIEALSAHRSPDPWDFARFTAPVPRLAEGHWLGANGARAMIDVSDGLLADAGHLARASGVAIIFDGAAIPSSQGCELEHAIRSGEEYELLVAVPASDAAHICAAFASRFDTPIAMVGEVHATHEAGEVRLRGLLAGDGNARVELPGGYSHFSA